MPFCNFGGVDICPARDGRLDGPRVFNMVTRKGKGNFKCSFRDLSSFCQWQTSFPRPSSCEESSGQMPVAGSALYVGVNSSVACQRMDLLAFFSKALDFHLMPTRTRVSNCSNIFSRWRNTGSALAHSKDNQHCLLCSGCSRFAFTPREDVPKPFWIWIIEKH